MSNPKAEDWPTNERINNIGLNGNNGEHYGQASAKRHISKGGRIIRAIRLARNYKVKELAEIMGFAVNTLSNWESGRAKPTYDDVEMIIDHLDCSMDEARRYTETANNLSNN